MAEIIIAGVNLKPFFRSSGNAKKKINDGRTAQKILVDSSIIFCAFFVSLYSQIMAKIDTSGSEDSTAATGVNFLPSSDTPVMIRADMMIFMMYCIVYRGVVDFFSSCDILLISLRKRPLPGLVPAGGFFFLVAFFYFQNGSLVIDICYLCAGPF